MHQFGRSTSEWRSTHKHVPKRHSERIKIGTDVCPDSGKLFRAGELWGASKTSGNRNRCFGLGCRYSLCSPKSMNFAIWLVPFTLNMMLLGLIIRVTKTCSLMAG